MVKVKVKKKQGSKVRKDQEKAMVKDLVKIKRYKVKIKKTHWSKKWL